MSRFTRTHPKFIQSVCDSALLGVNATFWQMAYEAWRKQNRWKGWSGYAIGSVITGLSDGGFTFVVAMAQTAYHLHKGTESRNYKAICKELALTALIYILIASAWQPLVKLGAWAGHEINHDNEMPQYLLGATFIFLGNYAAPWLVKHFNCLPNLTPEPFFLALGELGFFLTGPLKLGASDTGLNNRAIAYAGGFTAAFGLLAKGMTHAKDHCSKKSTDDSYTSLPH